MKKQFRFLCLMLAIALVFTLSSATFSVSAETPDADGAAVEETAIEETEKVVEPAFDSLDEFEKIGATGDLELYMLDKTKEWVCFAVRNTKTEKIWYSMPQMLDSITVANKKKEARSTAVITYQNESKEDAYLYTSDAIKAGNYKIEEIENGVRVTYNYPLKQLKNKKKILGFTIPMVFRLTENGGFEAGVEFSAIKCEKESEYNLISVSVLPYFGSAKYQSDGYMMVPDGSGALIANDYVPLDGITKKLVLDVYEKDGSINNNYQIINTENTVVPVFGTKGDDQGFVAVINKGDAVSKIEALPARVAVPYTSVYATFIYYYQDTFDTTNNWFNKAYNQIAYNYSDIECCSVVYYPLEGEETDYFGMAKRYRKHLTEVEGVKANNISPDVSLNIDTIGAITKTVSKFGFIVDAVQEVTTFDQAGEMITKFKEAGVDSMDFRYTGWMDGGIEGRFVTNAKPESVLGGKTGLKNLISTAENNNTNLFFDVDIVNTYKGKFNWSIRKVAVRNILNEYVEQGFFNLDIGVKKADGLHYLVCPSYYKTEIEKFTKDFKQYNQENISFADLGENLYSNFYNGSKFLNRQQSEEYVKQALETASGSYKNITVDNGHAYTYKYANKVVGLPMYTSGYTMTGTDIPFIQIALHGLVEYTESAHNLADDPNVQFLRILETGAMPYYLLTWSESTVFLDTTFNTIYSSNFYTWNETAIKDYKTLSSVFNGYCDKEITDHEIITENVRSTVYGDSLKVVVNYGETDYVYNGATVKAGGFIVVKEGK